MFSVSKLLVYNKFDTVYQIIIFSRKDDDKKEKPARKKKAPRAQTTKVSITEDAGWTTVSGPDTVAKEKPLFEEDAEITVELVNQKIAELSSIRGRRGANRQKNINTIELLSDICVKEELGNKK